MRAHSTFFDGARYAVFGVTSPGRSHGRLLVAALRRAGKVPVSIMPEPSPGAGEGVAPNLEKAGPADGVVILPPHPWSDAAAEFTRDALRQCAEASVANIWVYPAGDPSGAWAAVRDAGVDAVVGSCPCLYVPGAGFPHNLHQFIERALKRL